MLKISKTSLMTMMMMMMMMIHVQGVFFTGNPPKSFNYKKVNLG